MNVPNVPRSSLIDHLFVVIFDLILVLCHSLVKKKVANDDLLGRMHSLLTARSSSSLSMELDWNSDSMNVERWWLMNESIIARTDASSIDPNELDGADEME
jgi:hypothetical protein